MMEARLDMTSIITCSMAVDDDGGEDVYETIWPGIIGTCFLYGIQGVALWLLFGCLRTCMDMVYAPRNKLRPNRVPPKLPSGLIA